MKESLAQYQLLLSVTLGWALAQILKTIIYYMLEKEFRAERLIGSGGMPSSHSSTVCSLLTATYFIYGIKTFEFTISLVLAIIVMHDAMGVRLETGKQAKVLNRLLQSGTIDFKGEEFEKGLKELVGHTPIQVFCGALLGVLTSVMVELLIF